MIPHERNSGNDDSTNIIIFASPSRVVPFSNAIRVPFQMLDTGNFNKAVKRNIERFPDDFMFQLNDEEYSNLKFQIGIASSYGGRRTNPYVFTEQGVAMLSSVLRSEAAIRVNISIMRAFVMVRQALMQPSNEFKQLRKSVNQLKEYIEEILADQNDINEETQAQLDAISESLAELQMKKSTPRKRIGFQPSDDSTEL
nr:ORF6N domain-containing protein [Muribaculum intestinale]